MGRLLGDLPLRRSDLRPNNLLTLLLDRPAGRVQPARSRQAAFLLGDLRLGPDLLVCQRLHLRVQPRQLAVEAF